MRRTLFRQQALDARQDAAFGPPLQIRQPGATWLTAAVLLLAAALVAFGCTGEYTRKAHVSGHLVPSAGLVDVFTPQSGTVIRRTIAEGQTVKRGDVLMVLDSDRASASSATGAQASVLDALRVRQASLRQEQNNAATIDDLALATLAERRQGLDAEAAQLGEQSALQAQRVASAQQVFERHEELARSSYVSDAMLQTRRDEWLAARQELASVRRSLLAIERDRRAAALDAAAAQLKRANTAAAFGRQIAEIAQQLAEAESRRTVTLVAPAGGTVTTLRTDIGQFAAPGTPLLTILPQGAALQAHLLVPTSAAGFIKAHQPVALRIHAFPFQRFGHQSGEVLEVGRTVLQRGAQDGAATALSEPVYLIKVRLAAQDVQAYGERAPLQAGMTLDADVQLDRRRLLQWLFDPLWAVARRI
jgi:membrane fusion protein